MRVLFYGCLAEVVARELEVEVTDCSIAELRAAVIAEHPRAEKVLTNSRTHVYVGGRRVDDDHMVRAADCVEFLAPVSGG
ncbi:MAG TPA: MoaD/ThiS family protein [Sphingomicrobium sp.]|nr:MoaD/ThiS family protein [Sphingomicrobium sp.]